MIGSRCAGPANFGSFLDSEELLFLDVLPRVQGFIEG